MATRKPGHLGEHCAERETVATPRASVELSEGAASADIPEPSASPRASRAPSPGQPAASTKGAAAYAISMDVDDLAQSFENKLTARPAAQARRFEHQPANDIRRKASSPANAATHFVPVDVEEVLASVEQKLQKAPSTQLADASVGPDGALTNQDRHQEEVLSDG
eukprot:gene20422-24460_t